MRNSIVSSIRERLGIGAVDAAIVLGSGWDPLPGAVGEAIVSCSYAEVGLRAPVAPGHAGELTLMDWAGKKVLVFSGRTHLYEGHGPQAVAENVRVAAELGAKILVLTNANGSLNHEWPLGTIVALSDHLNLTGTSPLDGADFVDLTNAYDPLLRESLIRAAEGYGIEVPTGVYAMFPGPHFETAAEAKAVKILGADVLGMSTVLETIAARGCEMRVLALSTVTAHEASGETIDPDDVVAIAQAQAGRIAPAIFTCITEALKG